MFRVLVSLAAAHAADLTWTPGYDLRLRNHYDWNGAELPNPYARLPASAADAVRSSVYGLSTQAAGVQLAFTSNASSLSLRWQVGESSCAGEATVPIALCAGADLYEWDPNTRQWRWVATATNITLAEGVVGKTEYAQEPLYSPPSPGTRSYLLNLPAYAAAWEDFLDARRGVARHLRLAMTEAA